MPDRSAGWLVRSVGSRAIVAASSAVPPINTGANTAISARMTVCRVARDHVATGAKVVSTGNVARMPAARDRARFVALMARPASRSSMATATTTPAAIPLSPATTTRFAAPAAIPVYSAGAARPKTSAISSAAATAPPAPSMAAASHRASLGKTRIAVRASRRVTRLKGASASADPPNFHVDGSGTVTPLPSSLRFRPALV